jgi:hypothetical protein
MNHSPTKQDENPASTFIPAKDALQPGKLPPGLGDRPSKTLFGIRLLLVIGGLGIWFWTQALIGTRVFPEDRIGDRLHEWSAPMNTFLNGHPTTADALLIASSALIDVLGGFLLLRSLFGPTIRPFLGLLILLGLRQICQGLCALPPPDGMIWRNPGFPSLLVTYGVANDLFYSGHTAVAVFGAVELARMGWRWLRPVAVAVVMFEVTAVLVLRAHYTMDVFTGAVTALLVANLVTRLAPYCDRALDHLISAAARLHP